MKRTGTMTCGRCGSEVVTGKIIALAFCPTMNCANSEANYLAGNEGMKDELER